jgi:cyclase
MSTSLSVGTQPLAVVTEVSDGIFAYTQPDGTWWINNTGFLVGSRGVVSIDACATEHRTRRYLDTIENITGKPVRTLVNTHHHGDHTFGNCLFTEATIVAQEGARQAMLAWGPPRSAPYWSEVAWGDITLEPPFLTFRDEITLWIDDLRCEIRHVGTSAHTGNDSVAWLPERGVLFSGDLVFNGGTPFLLQGSVSGAIQVLSEVISPLRPATIVPGHGPVCGMEAVDQALAYLRFIQATAEAGKSAGLSPLQLARETDLGEFASLSDPERIVGNLHRAYAELDGAAPGAQIDLHAALAEMVAYNGGQPLSCHA